MAVGTTSTFWTPNRAAMSTSRAPSHQLSTPCCPTPTVSPTRIHPVTTVLSVPSRALRARAHLLDATARAEGHRSYIPEVLFVCINNAGRSQMVQPRNARSLEGRDRMRSAGSEPADRLNPAIVRGDARDRHRSRLLIGYQIPQAQLTDEVVRAADVVITMGCGDACPIYPGLALRGLAARADPSLTKGHHGRASHPR